MNFRNAITAMLISSAALVATAGEIKTFSQQDFDRLAQTGKPVVVDVSAPWCPTCKAQKPIVDSLAKQPAYKDVTILTVDFDSEKTVLKQFKVNMQSTLIAFNGGKETARSVGDATPAGIEGIFKKAVN
jgi:thiol-disulfide isomerase/thioredoxin